LVALVESIATTAGVSEDTVTVARQIHDDLEQIFELSYVITLPPDEPAALVAESRRIKAAFGLTKMETDANIEKMTANIVAAVDQAVGSGFYEIEVRSISIPEVQNEHMQPTTTTAQSEEEGKDDTGLRIIGGIVGAAIALLIAGSCASAYFYVRKKSRNNHHLAEAAIEATQEATQVPEVVIEVTQIPEAAIEVTQTSVHGENSSIISL